MGVRVVTGKADYVGEYIAGKLAFRGNNIDVDAFKLIKAVQFTPSGEPSRWEIHLRNGSCFIAEIAEIEGSFTVAVKGLAQPIVVEFPHIHSVEPARS